VPVLRHLAGHHRLADGVVFDLAGMAEAPPRLSVAGKTNQVLGWFARPAACLSAIPSVLAGLIKGRFHEVLEDNYRDSARSVYDVCFH
jgi:hypothetical protein